jgi:Ser/Thr protein kinase RdoA (MazF antagonist)
MFVSVEASGRSWCLRRWPLDFDERRLRFIHRVLLDSCASGFTGVPELAKTEDGETVLTLVGRLYDAQEWLAGEPLARVSLAGEPMPNVVVSLSPARITRLATALACFHRSTAHPYRHVNSAKPLSVRLARLAGDAETRHTNLLSNVQVRARDEEREVALRWLELLPMALTYASSESLPETAPEDYVLCHGDLWPAHVHFDGDTFVGFTDFESLSFATPAFDLAQTVLHFGGWEICEDVLQSYETITTLDLRDRVTLLIEAVVDLASEGYWSLEALYGNASFRTSSMQRAAHTLNLREFIGSLEQVVEEVRTRG